MAYLALYRKYRPLTFETVVGQEFVTTALRHAVAGERLAHAYLFSGPRGTGKTSTARIFARAINCATPQSGEPCNACSNCESILAGQWGLVEIDGASHNRVEDMRTLLDGVMHVPMAGAFNVYIIDEVHMLSNAAFNAFLKTLEEPPPHVKFILATTEPFKVPRTIHSRCQHYLFQTVPTAIIAEHVTGICREEGLAIDELSARLVAEAGNGSIRDALSVLDRVLAYCGGEITPDAVQKLLGLGDIGYVMGLLEAAMGEEDATFMMALEDLVLQGSDLAEVTKSLLLYGRVLLFLAAGIEDAALLGMPMTAEQLQQAQRTAGTIGRDRLYALLEILADLQHQLKFDVDKRLGFELGLLQVRRTLCGEGVAVAAPESVSRVQVPERQAKATPPPSPAKAPPAQPAPRPAPQQTAAPVGDDEWSGLAAQLEKKSAGKAPKSAPAPRSTPAEKPKAKPASSPSNAPAGTLSIAAALPGFWKTFLTDCLADHPAWVPLLQGLVLEAVEDHSYKIDFDASHPIAAAWIRDKVQVTEIKAVYQARIGQPLSLRKKEAGASRAEAALEPTPQPTLSGMEGAPGDWKSETASTLKELFPDAQVRES